MKIGSPIPPWRVPTFTRGTLTFSSLAQFQGTSLVLCCIPSLRSTQACLLEAQYTNVQDRHAVLAACISSSKIHDLPLPFPSSDFRLPLLTDPLNRLGRSLGLSRQLSVKRCETLFFDQYGQLEFRLIHDLNLRGFSSVLEITERLFTFTKMAKPVQHFSSDRPQIEEVEAQPTV